MFCGLEGPPISVGTVVFEDCDSPLCAVFVGPPFFERKGCFGKYISNSIGLSRCHIDYEFSLLMRDLQK